MLDPDRYFRQEKKSSSGIERPVRRVGTWLHTPLNLPVSVKRLEGGCLLYTLVLGCSWANRSCGRV
jgi:hypothetical protein